LTCRIAHKSVRQTPYLKTNPANSPATGRRRGTEPEADNVVARSVKPVAPKLL
jgi:hypothetical protein